MPDTEALKKQLTTLFKKAIQLGDFDFTPEQIKSQCLGRAAANKNDILKTEKRLNITLPEDYKQLLMIYDGFDAPCDIEMNFEPIDKIDYLKNIDSGIIDIWRETGNQDASNHLERSILIGGIEQEQYFLLIPPSDQSSNSDDWQYWKFSVWQPGEEAFESLSAYFTEVIAFIEECINDNN